MFETIKTVLVDDELGALEAVEAIISNLAPEFKIVGKAQSVAEAYRLINNARPDLVFLDIQLRDQTGFDLLDMEFDCDFEVVFVTAYDEYAIQAFDKNALSYLLKPLSIEAFKRVKERIIKVLEVGRSNSSEMIKTVLQGRLAIPNGSVVDYVDPDLIVYIKADGSYCEIYLSNGNKLVVSKPLNLLEKKLNPQWFFRSHRSYVVNSRCVRQWNKAEGGWLLMDNSHEVPVSRSGRIIVGNFLN